MIRNFASKIIKKNTRIINIKDLLTKNKRHLSFIFYHQKTIHPCKTEQKHKTEH
nr:MAG TPA: hypothetical protein [Caudoviricetes sp.]